jgi:hypothetical protein
MCVSIQADKIIYIKLFVQYKIMTGKQYSRHILELQQGFLLALQKESFRDLKRLATGNRCHGVEAEG